MIWDLGVCYAVGFGFLSLFFFAAVRHIVFFFSACYCRRARATGFREEDSFVSKLWHVGFFSPLKESGIMTACDIFFPYCLFACLQ